MQKFFSCFFLVYLQSCFGIIPITEDVTKARRLAQSYDLPVIYLFLGSDWCDWSQKFLSEIFASQAFEEAIGSQFIFAKIDFPEVNRKDETMLIEHQRMKDAFHVESFPTLIMTDSEEKEITRISYVAEEPKKYAEHLRTLYLDYKALKRDYERTDFFKASIEAVQKLYQRANELQCPELKQCILDKGLSAEKGSYFALERYTELARDKKTQNKEALLLRKRILQDGGNEDQGVRLRLALLDFQANEDDPQKAVEPIGSYIADFGKSDQDNLWKLHLIVSEYFQKQGLRADAQEHAHKVLAEAPDEVKTRVKEVLECAFVNDENK